MSFLRSCLKTVLINFYYRQTLSLPDSCFLRLAAHSLAQSCFLFLTLYNDNRRAGGTSTSAWKLPASLPIAPARTNRQAEKPGVPAPKAQRPQQSPRVLLGRPGFSFWSKISILGNRGAAKTRLEPSFLQSLTFLLFFAIIIGRG